MRDRIVFRLCQFVMRFASEPYRAHCKTVTGMGGVAFDKAFHELSAQIRDREAAEDAL